MSYKAVEVEVNKTYFEEDDFIMLFKLIDFEGAFINDLDGFEFKASLKYRGYSEELTNEEINVTNGLITVVFPQEMTDNFGRGTYRFDLKVTTPDGHEYVVFSKNISVEEDNWV